MPHAPAPARHRIITTSSMREFVFYTNSPELVKRAVGAFILQCGYLVGLGLTCIQRRVLGGQQAATPPAVREQRRRRPQFLQAGVLLHCRQAVRLGCTQRHSNADLMRQLALRRLVVATAPPIANLHVDDPGNLDAQPGFQIQLGCGRRDSSDMGRCGSFSIARQCPRARSSPARPAILARAFITLQ